MDRQWWFRLIVVSAGCVGLLGCHGPLTKPMVDRLDEETQAKVDVAWANMLSAPEPVERTLLLDAILAAQLHQFGVDRLRLESEKFVGDARVIMEIRFDRLDPASDQLTVTYVDRDGREIRREVYTREDVQGRIAYLYDMPRVSEDTDQPLSGEMEQDIAERLARWEEIRAVLGPLMQENTAPGDEPGAAEDAEADEPPE